ncbi:hypothetical protein SCHPADRAFT_751190 [Schizopora paradoxa]|uniref:Uncharacterized protein n=1 Tax=Schizopora paradoxa TaxID=27342 RepID=A0A0H2QZW7_9AGAM|nr:hypothetical protein SCHPADRAFT_751190 [Schizopora paradoxa]
MTAEAMREPLCRFISNYPLRLRPYLFMTVVKAWQETSRARTKTTMKEPATRRFHETDPESETWPPFLDPQLRPQRADRHDQLTHHSSLSTTRRHRLREQFESSLASSDDAAIREILETHWQRQAPDNESIAYLEASSSKRFVFKGPGLERQCSMKLYGILLPQVLLLVLYNFALEPTSIKKQPYKLQWVTR